MAYSQGEIKGVLPGHTHPLTGAKSSAPFRTAQVASAIPNAIEFF